MKTLKKVPIELLSLNDDEYIPKELEEGILYYSKQYKVSMHLCLCGCKMKTCLPIQNGEWSLNVDNGKPTITPSVLQLNGCKSHYVITNGIGNLM